MSVIQISLRARLLCSCSDLRCAMLSQWSGGTEPGAAARATELVFLCRLVSVEFSELQVPFWKVGEKRESVGRVVRVRAHVGR